MSGLSLTMTWRSANADLADLIDALGDLYELDGAVIYRVLAYRKAARRSATRELGRRAEAGRLTELHDVGDTIAAKLPALVETGTIPALVKLRRSSRPASSTSCGCPASARRRRASCSMRWASTARRPGVAAQTAALRDVAGFGAKAEENILAAIAAGGGAAARASCSTAPCDRRAAARRPAGAAGLRRVELAGSCAALSRHRQRPRSDRDRLGPAGAARRVCRARRARVRGGVGDAGPRADPQRARHRSADRRARAVRQPAAALHRLKHHNVALREAAVKRGLHVSECGILDDETGQHPPLRDRGGGLRPARPRRSRPSCARTAGELAADFASAPPRRARRPARRPALPHHRLRRARHDRARWRSPRSSAATSTWRSPTTPRPTGSATTCRRPSCAGTWRAIREGQRRCSTGFTLLAGSEVNILPDGSLDYDGRPARPSSTGSWHPSTRPSA